MKKAIIIVSIVLAIILLMGVVFMAITIRNNTDPFSQKKRLEKEYEISLPKDAKVLYFATTGLLGYPAAKLQISDNDVNFMNDMVSRGYHAISDDNKILGNLFPEEWGCLDDMKHVTHRYENTFTPKGNARTGTRWIYFVKTPTGENYLYLDK